jgi:hypothetical protein
LCSTEHPVFDDCPPECRGCRRRHLTTVYCAPLKSLEYREEQERYEAFKAERRGENPGAVTDSLAWVG